jgi:hypothetical protein
MGAGWIFAAVLAAERWADPWVDLFTYYLTDYFRYYLRDYFTGTLRHVSRHDESSMCALVPPFRLRPFRLKFIRLGDEAHWAREVGCR